MRRYVVLAFSFAVAAAPSGRAQQLPPVRALGPVTNVSPKGALGSTSLALPLSSGSVIVNDTKRRQLILLDSSLTRVKVLGDTSAASPVRYASGLAGLLPYRADSSIFIETQSLSAVVLDENGEVARVMAVPSVRDAPFMVGGPFGTPGFDGRGRFVFRGGTQTVVRQVGGQTPATPLPAGQFADSAPVYRLDMATRARETLGQLTIPKQSRSPVRDQSGGLTGMLVSVNPMTLVDDWALMPDGRVAIVRGADFHVDWLETDGRWVSTGKIPYHWERMDDDVKRSMLDSVQAVEDSVRDKAIQALAANPNATVAGVVRSTTTTVADGRTQTQTFVQTVRMVEPKYVADYRPVFRMGGVRADADGNLWVRTTEPSPNGPIYYVIDGRGQLIDRVRLPFGRVIVGFSPGSVYMGVEDDAGVRLERARIR